MASISLFLKWAAMTQITGLNIPGLSQRLTGVGRLRSYVFVAVALDGLKAGRFLAQPLRE